MRRNFVLIYELLDEMIDFGYPQNTCTEDLRPLIYNEVVMVEGLIPRGGWFYLLKKLTFCVRHLISFKPQIL
jgi:hypothetical protein